jgi:glycosyltransferase involved in cell wall biosynthesis
MEQTTQIARPRISVIIASVNGASYVDECLAALEKQTLKDQAEVIVADRCGNGVTHLVRQKYPHVRLISFSEPKTIPELRAVAMKNARGDILALTEDHCLPEPHWYERMLAAHQAHYGAVGGAVENDPSIRRLVDWAVFFCEYGQFMNPVPAGETGEIPGNNASYRREFLAHLTDLLDHGGSWENFLHSRLRQRGIKLYSDPSIIVFHKKVFGLGYFLRQRYHYGRSYAAMRLERAPAWKRLLYAGFCPLLPVLAVGRISRRVFSKKRHLGKFIQAQPLLWIFSLSWAWGEFVGYLSGSGDSLLRVE